MDKPEKIEDALKSAEADDDDARWAAPVLAAEVRRLREQYERANAAANGWNAKACELEREAHQFRAEIARLREESRLFREAGHAAELRIVELREENASLARKNELYLQDAVDMEEQRDVAISAKVALREENVRLKAELGVERGAAKPVLRAQIAELESAPRYSTEAVDALLTAADASFDSHLFAGCECGRALKTAVEAVRASREPKHGQG